MIVIQRLYLALLASASSSIFRVPHTFVFVVKMGSFWYCGGEAGEAK